MTGRIFLAGLVGGIVMFIWTSAAHMFIGLGEVGVRELSHEQAVLDALSTSLGGQSGFYLFPAMGMNLPPNEREAAMKNYGATLAKNPSGLLIYYPVAARPLAMGRWLTIEFLTELAEALLAVFLLARTAIQGFSGRWGFISTVGIVAAIATNISYWNWYGFPGDYTLAYIITQLVGFILVGLVAALLLRGRTLPA